MRALLIGATGATGKDLVNALLHDPFYTEVVVFVRRSTGIDHPKLKEIITNFDKLEEVAESINGDALFSCIGTTLKTAGSKDKQYHIDFEIPLQFAQRAKTAGVQQMILLSAYGASAKSRVFYSRMKGELENALAKLEFTSYVIFRPGLLLRKNTDRAGEKISAAVIKFLNRLGLIRKFKSMPTDILAEKMAKAPKVFLEGQQLIELDKIFLF